MLIQDREVSALNPVTEEFARRTGPALQVAEDAERVAGASHAMSLRFHGGGKLLAFGNGGSAADAQHVSVEFLHPVLVGKRALPAFVLTTTRPR